MFKTVISQTPLTEDIVNDFFPNIYSHMVYGDNTMLSTLRALVAPRMRDDEKLTLVFSDWRRYSVPMENTVNTVEKKRDYLIRQYGHPDDNLPSETVKIYNLTGNTEAIKKDMEIFKVSFCSIFKGWHQLEKITQFFQKEFEVLCFVNPELKAVFIITDGMDIRRWHYLQCSIFAFLPWYFDPEKGVSEDEMNLIKSLQKKSPEAYLECIAKIAKKYDFNTARIKKLLKGFETRVERKTCDSVKKGIEDIDRFMEQYYETIASQMRRRRELEIKLLGLETKIANTSADSELMEYFLSNKNIKLMSVDDTAMRFVARGYIDFFDEDRAKEVINNPYSYIYSPNRNSCENIISHDDMKMFMEAIFLKQKLRIRVCAAYGFELGISVYPIPRFAYGIDFRDCTPNPHIDEYSCMGNYRMTINQLVKDNNYIMALEQTLSSCKSLNFGDSTVMTEFMRRIYGISGRKVNMRCIELPDGRVATPKEAIQYLKEEEKNNEQKN